MDVFDVPQLNGEEDKSGFQIIEEPDRERDLAIVEGVEAELKDIQAALERLDLGTYGLCEACGKPIEEEKLAGEPAARLCIEDHIRAEPEGTPPLEPE